jgi:hypothetical protein
MDKIFPDILVSWPYHIDYPLWRQQIHDNRSLFAKVIIVFTNMNVPRDYRGWVREAMKDDNVSFVESDPVESEEDWRDIAVNTGLRKSKADWVWFTEQDFFWKEGFWEKVEKEMGSFEVVSVCIEGRMHPCCIFAKRAVIEKTRKDFSVTTDRLDHFGKFQEDVDVLSSPRFWLPDDLYCHLGGLSQNIFLMKDPRAPLYYPAEFKKYCEDCLKVTVPMHRDFERMFRDYAGV